MNGSRDNDKAATTTSMHQYIGHKLVMRGWSENEGPQKLPHASMRLSELSKVASFSSNTVTCGSGSWQAHWRRHLVAYFLRAKQMNARELSTYGFFNSPLYVCFCLLLLVLVVAVVHKFWVRLALYHHTRASYRGGIRRSCSSLEKQEVSIGLR